MGLFKKLKKAVRGVENFGRRVVGKGNIGEDDSSRSEAAGQLMKRNVDVSRQAGGGQIKYTGEEEYTT